MQARLYEERSEDTYGCTTMRCIWYDDISYGCNLQSKTVRSGIMYIVINDAVKISILTLDKYSS